MTIVGMNVGAALFKVGGKGFDVGGTADKIKWLATNIG